MKKVKLSLIVIIVILLNLSFYCYSRYKYNERIYGYDIFTLTRIYVTVDNILDEYEKRGRQTVPDEYLVEDILTLARYAQLSPKISEVSYAVEEIETINYEKISEEEYEYLTSVRDKLKIFIDEVNLEHNKDNTKRIGGIFNKCKTKELNEIFQRVK